MAVTTTSTEDNLNAMSLHEDIELTNEEEDSLLMSVDTPDKSSADGFKSQRKTIVYDLDEEEEDDDDNGRDKFKSERTIVNNHDCLDNISGRKKNFSRNIPDTLTVDRTKREFGIRATKKDNYVSRPRRWKKNKGFRQRFGSSSPRGGSKPDLRRFINQTRSYGQTNISENLLMSGLGFTATQNYQMKLGILNPIIAQNQLLMNALLAQNAKNPLLSRLQVNGQNLLSAGLNNGLNHQKPEDIQITINNTNASPKNTLSTKSRFRCLVSQDDSMAESSVNDVIENMPSVPKTSEVRQPNNKTPFKTLFAKHLKEKAEHSKADKQGESSLFGDAFKEVEVGVDNDYLQKMEELKKKREELLRRKEESRLAMADQRLEEAMKLKQKFNH